LYYNPRFTGNHYETLKSTYAFVVVVVVVVAINTSPFYVPFYTINHYETLKSTYACVVVAINTSPFYVPFYTIKARNIDSFQWRFLSNAFKKIHGFQKVTKNAGMFTKARSSYCMHLI
jgi:hypothetical protein